MLRVYRRQSTVWQLSAETVCASPSMYDEWIHTQAHRHTHTYSHSFMSSYTYSRSYSTHSHTLTCTHHIQWICHFRHKTQRLLCVFCVSLALRLSHSLPFLTFLIKSNGNYFNFWPKKNCFKLMTKKTIRKTPIFSPDFMCICVCILWVQFFWIWICVCWLYK